MMLQSQGRVLPKSFFLIFSILIVSLSLSSCDPGRIYEKNIEVKDGLWPVADSIAFEFSIPDSSQKVNLLYNIRYNNEYPYYNVYIKHFLYDSTNRLLKSDLVTADLFNPKTGVPYGSGLGSSYDYSVVFINGIEFPYSGKYTLKALHYMREEPLRGIESFGLRVEKSEAK